MQPRAVTFDYRELFYWSDQTPETREKLGDLLGKVVRMTEFMKVGIIE